MNRFSKFIEEQDARVTKVMEQAVHQLEQYIAVTNITVQSLQKEVAQMMDQTKQFSVHLNKMATELDQTSLMTRTNNSKLDKVDCDLVQLQTIKVDRDEYTEFK